MIKAGGIVDGGGSSPLPQPINISTSTHSLDVKVTEVRDEDPTARRMAGDLGYMLEYFEPVEYALDVFDIHRSNEFVVRSWHSLREIADLLHRLKQLELPAAVDTRWSDATEGLLPAPTRNAEEAAISGSKLQIRQFFGVLIHGCPHGAGREVIVFTCEPLRT
eukprot:SAG11_NODE_1479_length_4835_cov_34.478252_2_plen_163_part_00